MLSTHLDDALDIADFAVRQHEQLSCSFLERIDLAIVVAMMIEYINERRHQFGATTIGINCIAILQRLAQRRLVMKGQHVESKTAQANEKEKTVNILRNMATIKEIVF